MSLKECYREGSVSTIYEKSELRYLFSNPSAGELRYHCLDPRAVGIGRSNARGPAVATERMPPGTAGTSGTPGPSELVVVSWKSKAILLTEFQCFFI